MEEPIVVILCGGTGTRLREHTEHIPKPLVQIGGMPVLVHIMKHYAHYGFKKFILCLGYKGEMIKDYFIKHEWLLNDFTLVQNKIIKHTKTDDDFSITFIDTGQKTNTGGRLKKIEKYITGNNFLVTYGDGLSNVDIKKLFEHHVNKGKIATLTSINPTSPFGVIEIEDGLVKSFKEKPKLEGFINGGFFAFNKKIFDYLNDDSILEEEPLRKLASEGQLATFVHNDFWACMDTFKDNERLNAIWESTGGKAPWRTWD